MSRKAVFIDKDGTLVENVPYNVDPGLVVLTPNAIAGLQTLRRAGFELVLISNQSGVARGWFDENSLLLLFDHLRDLLHAGGIELLDAYYCPHHPSGCVERYAVGCECRKPSPGLVLRAAVEHDLDLKASYLVGDILDDIESGKRAGCRTVFLDRGSETEWHLGHERTPDFIASDLGEAARIIVSDEELWASAYIGGQDHAR